MKRRRPLHHPLAELFLRAAESVTTSMSASSVCCYQTTAHYFLRYLGTHHPEIRSLQQLRRDPHILGWLAALSSRNPPLAKSTRSLHVISLRRLFEELAWTHDLPALLRLLISDDVPRRDARLPRPLTPEQDQLLQQELLRRNDLASNVLLLLRHTGMRIGESVDLSYDCLRSLGPHQWAIHVPLGKLRTERLVPIDSSVRQLVLRLRFFRSLDPVPPDGLLLARRHSRGVLLAELRAALANIVTAAGISARIVPHQFRHTFATEMLRSGVSFPALMKLLGHSTPKMTLLYAEITQADLQREFSLARSQPRHLVPVSKVSTSTTGPQADLPGVLRSLQAAQHVLEMFRRTLADRDTRRILDRLLNRLIKIRTEIRKLEPEQG
jgi:site-specific recombinase XerD